MVVIVTGTINSGKTTRMKALHEEHGGDGFVMEKTMDKDTVKSYHALRLSTGEKRLLVLREGYQAEGFKEAVRIGPYRFSAEALKWVETTLKTLMKRRIEPLFLDEVGGLELRGEGFDSILKVMATYPGTIYLCVRENHIKGIVRRYRFHPVTVQGSKE
ncbi:MAG: nucleoside-triphosphatase [Candidatus Izemoplasmataceae bacterium]